jgi:hypothetical protein
MIRHGHVMAILGLLAGSCVSAHSAEPVPSSGPAQLTLPPGSTRPAERPPEQQPIQCDLRASPDYVAGIDAQGRDVIPADVPTGREVEISTEVFVETRSRNPRLRGTGVVVNLPGLGAPACVPLEENLRK